MPDVIETLGRSVIQHGKDSDRIYLMKLDPRDAATIVARLERLAETKDYGKLFCKVPVSAAKSFVQAGYQEEARIPRFFKGRMDAAFMCRFRKRERARVSEEQRALIAQALKLAEEKRASGVAEPALNHHVRQLNEEDVPQLAVLYRAVFPSYPFPIFDEAYLRGTMATHIRYFGAFEGHRLVAASSAETDTEARNAEMTDFATDPVYRRQGLAVQLLQTMEKDMQAAGFATLYTIAREVSVGMNITFARCGYRFGGTLINNTQISGRVESMNVWYKNLELSQ